MNLPERVRKHKIETLAVRRVITSVPIDWLIRSLEERDYGIDLMFEIFNESYPTGRIAFVQSKGRDKSFEFADDEIKLGNFPVKTVAYALRLRDPFFVFYTSIDDKKTVFVWLQRYVSLRLAQDSPQWRKQDSVTLYFPQGNDLATNGNKIEDLLRDEQKHDQTFEFLRWSRWLKLHINSVLSDEYDVAQSALEDIENLKACNAIIEDLLVSPVGENLAEVTVTLQEIAASRKVTQDQDEVLRDYVIYLNNADGELLDVDDIAGMEHEMCGTELNY